MKRKNIDTYIGVERSSRKKEPTTLRPEYRKNASCLSFCQKREKVGSHKTAGTRCGECVTKKNTEGWLLVTIDRTDRTKEGMMMERNCRDRVDQDKKRTASWR